MEVFSLGMINSLPYVEIVTTTYCNLHCKDCANLISHYERPYHIDFDLIIHSLNKLLKLFDRIEIIGILGGEPFLYPNLTELIDYLCNEEKIEKVRIVTNGTILKYDIALLNKLKNDKIFVQVNHYSIVQANKAVEICEMFKNNRINYFYVDRTLEKWKKFGNYFNVSKDVVDLEKQFKNCEMKCHSILNGKLYYCPRSAHGDDLGMILESNVVDLADVSIDIEKTKINIIELLYKCRYLEACKICNAGTEQFIEIDAAVQDI